MFFLTKLVELLRPLVIVGIGIPATEALPEERFCLRIYAAPKLRRSAVFLSKLAELYHLPLLETSSSASQPVLWD